MDSKAGGGTDLFGKAGRVWLQQTRVGHKAQDALSIYLKLIDEFTVHVDQQDRE